MSIPPYFNSAKTRIDQVIESMFSAVDPDLDLLLESALYSSLPGGKRIRGSLALILGDRLGFKDKMQPLAVAIELIHTYSLIHDDLPAMDDDDLRRGKPTNHKVYGEDVAILTGDFLMVRAYHLLAEDLLKQGFKAENILAMISYISHRIGLDGMVGGQLMDIKSDHHSLDQARLEKIHNLKTGAFIEVACMAPFILAEGKESLKNHAGLVQLGQKIGLLFQVVDDLLDETGNEDKIGKTAGSDREKEKLTFVALMGIKYTRQYAAQLAAEMQDLVAQLPENIRIVFMDLIELIHRRDH